MCTTHTVRQRLSQDRITKWLALGLVCLGLVGCASSPLPPKLDAPQLALIDRVDLPYRVAVEPYQYGLYSRLLMEDLQATNVFARVGMLEDSPDAQLLARVVHPVSNDYVAVIPLFSILSLGVVPTWFPMEYGASFELAPTTSSCSRTPVEVDASYEGTLVMGWVSSILNLSTRRTVRDVRKTDRYRDAIAHAVALRADDIHRLAQGDC